MGYIRAKCLNCEAVNMLQYIDEPTPPVKEGDVFTAFQCLSCGETRFKTLERFE